MSSDSPSFGSYVPSRFAWHQRRSHPCRVGDLMIGGDAPIRVQSMCTTPTQDVAATVAQSIALAEAGCELVRITAPGPKDAEALAPIRAQFSQAGFAHIPICADIHFMPAAAMIAIEHVEKVRINPGNFADKKRFAVRDYSDAEYREELERVAERFLPLVERAQTLGRALRIGTNHGSLSDRVMNRFGDSPAGMVASALEFIDIAESANFHDIIISMKASNVKVMVAAYRLLVARLAERAIQYPLHLGVTEAGDGEDGRIKSAAGIGALLDDGIGDTIRVSLTEDPVAEIPVAQALAARYPRAATHPPAISDVPPDPINPYQFTPSASDIIRIGADIPVGGNSVAKVIAPAQATPGPHQADVIYAPGAPPPYRSLIIPAEAPRAAIDGQLALLEDPTLLAISDPGPLGWIRAYRLLHACIDDAFQRAEAKQVGSGVRHPLCLAVPGVSHLLDIAIITGALLIDGIGDAIDCPDAPQGIDWSFAVLQAVRARMSKTDYVACPSCGRTLFDLMEVTAHIREATAHLDGVTIAIMGCIVNGPGEMADADFGYVGSGPGKITLYRGKDIAMRNVPAAEARDHLIELIKAHGMWKDPAHQPG